MPGARYHPYDTQIELQAGYIVCAKVGFNYGEALDFILGWFGVDIQADDLATKHKSDKQNKQDEDDP